MALKIRLWRQGCTNNVSYRVVVADSRSPRDGKYIESIGWYNPDVRKEQQKYAINSQRLQHWLSIGAQMTETVESIAKELSPEVIKEMASKKETQKIQKAAKRRAA